MGKNQCVYQDARQKWNFFERNCARECQSKVRVATMTHDHDDTSHAIFNTISGICWKVNEFIDFDLKNRNSDLPACFSALICDFSQFINIHYQKQWNPGFKNIWKFIIYGLLKVR